MTTEPKTTRGTNFVKKWGRSMSAIIGIKSFIDDIRPYNKNMAEQLDSFFERRLGVDQKLKFWHCETMQFPKLNDRAAHETSEAGSQNDDPFNTYEYPYDGAPSGQADPYVKFDPLLADKLGVPFRIIHTRPITSERAKMAALSFIHQDDFLSSIFPWNNLGTPQCFLSLDNRRNLFKDDLINEATDTWYIWNNGKKPNPNKPKEEFPKKLHVFEHTITLISESAIRTLNWYFKTNEEELISVDNIEDISEKFRVDKWPKPTALKTFRLDWDVMVNIEESSALTGYSTTNTVEKLVTNHLGEFTRKIVNEKRDGDIKRSHTDPEWQYRGIDGADVDERAKTNWERYWKAIKPLKQNVSQKIDEEFKYNTDELKGRDRTDDEESFFQKQIKKNRDEYKAISEKLDRFDKFMSEGPKGGHSVTNDLEGTITVDRISPAPATALKEMQMITFAMTDPVKFKSATPGIYTQLHGKLKDGVVVEDDFHTETFVGYMKKIAPKDAEITYEELANKANIGFSEHFEGQTPIGGGDKWVTADMLKWASGGKKIAKNVEIICPDPRTMNKRIRKSLETK